MIQDIYNAAKAQAPDCLLVFRIGDFYEVFYDDAKYAAKTLGLTLTSRDKGGAVPMAGWPYHQKQSYVAKLLASGRRVALVEYDAETAKHLPAVEQSQ